MPQAKCDMPLISRARRDSNPRSFESESNTLSTELRAHGTYIRYRNRRKKSTVRPLIYAAPNTLCSHALTSSTAFSVCGPKDTSAMNVSTKRMMWKINSAAP